MRFRPHHGRPRCLLEQLAQHIWHHKLLWYIAVVGTATVILQLGLGPTLHNLIWGG